jgi:hypothetical protein
MSNDSFSVTTQKGWFSRLGSAFGGVLTGLALVVASIILLSWNEGRSVQSIRTNNEGAKAVTSVSADQIQSANEGKLIHLTAAAVAEGQRVDQATGIATDGLGLKRDIQYYQWVETSKSETRTKLGGGEETVTTYSYNLEWTPTAQDSSRFQQPAGHQNPPAALEDASFVADQAKLGAFTLDRDSLQQVTASTPLSMTAEQAAAAQTLLGKTVSVSENGLYIGGNPASPQPGDMKVAYSVAPQNTTLSVIGAQTNGVIRPYPTKAGSPLLMVREGTASSSEMFAEAKAANKVMTWILRAVGVVVMIAAFGMVLGPLGVLADVLPLLGTVVRMGTGLVAAILGISISLVVIALSWFAFRPLLSVGLLAVAGAVVAFLIWRGKQKKLLPAAASTVEA